MNLEQVKAILAQEDYSGADDYYEWDVIKKTHGSEHKTAWTCYIVKDAEGNHFRINEYRSNSGYWGDSEDWGNHVEQVIPKEVQTIEWFAVK